MKQTEIRFTLEGDDENQHSDQTEADNVANRSKRQRSEFEDSDHLPIPLSSPNGSVTSIDFAESRETIVNYDTAPHETRRRTPAEEDAERVHIVRL